MDINPESSLKKVLMDYFSVRSLRNSQIPYDNRGNVELNSIFHLKQPVQVEHQCLKLKQSCNGSSLLKFKLKILNDS